MHDYEGYVRSLEKIHEGVTKDYWSSFLDINRHQVNVGKTYLWVSAALIGVYSAAYETFYKQLASHACFIALAVISFVLAALAFGICLYAIPARKGYKTIPSIGWGEFSKEAYELLRAESKQVYGTFLSNNITKIDHATAYNFTTNQRRAVLLRITSWILISSFVIALFLSLSISLDSLVNTSNH